jgi:hypothetical protein
LFYYCFFEACISSTFNTPAGLASTGTAAAWNSESKEIFHKWSKDKFLPLFLSFTLSPAKLNLTSYSDALSATPFYGLYHSGITSLENSPLLVQRSLFKQWTFWGVFFVFVASSEMDANEGLSWAEQHSRTASFCDTVFLLHSFCWYILYNMRQYSGGSSHAEQIDPMPILTPITLCIWSVRTEQPPFQASGFEMLDALFRKPETIQIEN